MDTLDLFRAGPSCRSAWTRPRWLWTLLLVLLPATLMPPCTAWADTISDPKIIISSREVLSRSPFPVTGSRFSIVVPSGNSPPCVIGPIQTNCAFVNASGVTWNELTFVILPSDQPPPFFCDGRPFFAHCLFAMMPVDPEGAVTFFGGIGIANGAVFNMSLTGWLPGTGFAAAASTVPEPASAALLLSGVGYVLALFRFRRRHDT